MQSATMCICCIWAIHQKRPEHFVMHIPLWCDPNDGLINSSVMWCYTKTIGFFKTPTTRTPDLVAPRKFFL